MFDILAGLPMPVDVGLSGLKLGLIYCILTLGVHITFRIMDFADLGCEGVFPLGGCVAILLISTGVPAILATILGCVAGGIAGLVTGVLHTKLKIPAILSGIITMTALYTINMVILGFSSDRTSTIASLTVNTNDTIFGGATNLAGNIFQNFRLADPIGKLSVCLIVVLIVFIGIYLFFGTEVGMTVRSTGDNEKMSRAQGIDTDWMKILGLIISNALIALSGALMAQNSGMVDVKDGRGMIVVGLASIILGEIIFGRKSYKLQLVSMVVGTILYFILKSIAIEFKVNEYLDLVSAILIVVFLALSYFKGKITPKKKGAIKKC